MAPADEELIKYGLEEDVWYLLRRIFQNVIIIIIGINHLGSDVLLFQGTFVRFGSLSQPRKL